MWIPKLLATCFLFVFLISSSFSPTHLISLLGFQNRHTFNMHRIYFLDIEELQTGDNAKALAMLIRGEPSTNLTSVLRHPSQGVISDSWILVGNASTEYVRGVTGRIIIGQECNKFMLLSE
ncbi:hypothetical protein GDO78_005658 [Eleutherodactylus coqui]|uniref:Dirigent protein n=1 Tax=Eleutherodactylus coqui TaxID=57060 RepID=A0A8J6FLN8_ELECQ|nr:hypothetical protein GDO78_005658 [Eleutherodactylus coqui]